MGGLFVTSWYVRMDRKVTKTSRRNTIAMCLLWSKGWKYLFPVWIIHISVFNCSFFVCCLKTHSAESSIEEVMFILNVISMPFIRFLWRNLFSMAYYYIMMVTIFNLELNFINSLLFHCLWRVKLSGFSTEPTHNTFDLMFVFYRFQSSALLYGRLQIYCHVLEDNTTIYFLCSGTV